MEKFFDPETGQQPTLFPELPARAPYPVRLKYMNEHGEIVWELNGLPEPVIGGSKKPKKPVADPEEMVHGLLVADSVKTVIAAFEQSGFTTKVVDDELVELKKGSDALTINFAAEDSAVKAISDHYKGLTGNTAPAEATTALTLCTIGSVDMNTQIDALKAFDEFGASPPTINPHMQPDGVVPDRNK